MFILWRSMIAFFLWVFSALNAYQVDLETVVSAFCIENASFAPRCSSFQARMMVHEKHRFHGFQISQETRLLRKIDEETQREFRNLSILPGAGNTFLSVCRFVLPDWEHGLCGKEKMWLLACFMRVGMKALKWYFIGDLCTKVFCFRNRAILCLSEGNSSLFRVMHIGTEMSIAIRI